jgi:hypothetical protein
MGRRTKEEGFIREAYLRIKEVEEKEDVLFNRYEIGLASGLSPKGTDHVCNNLAQANFIKKQGKEEFRLTSLGCILAQQII